MYKFLFFLVLILYIFRRYIVIDFSGGKKKQAPKQSPNTNSNVKYSDYEEVE